MRKTVVIGLDCAPPRILYDEMKNELEYLGRIVGDGERYVLKSSHPPITIPAWAVMTTGKTPGELGLYGFRHRKPGSYGEIYIANSRLVRHPHIWVELGRLGYHSIVVGVPPSYPPKPIKGYLISDFITPDATKMYTWPPGLKREIEGLVGPYIFDVVYRSHEKDKIVKELWEMTEQHFKVLKYLVKNKKWDFMWFVEIGVDRVHHAFWKYWDKEHPKYEPGNKYEHVIPEYYRFLDKKIGELLQELPKDTLLVVVSDHGAKAMKGAFAVNQWLEEIGFLKLKRKPEKPCTDLKPDMVDWEHTKAWGWGGYYSRIFINIKGREPKGIVPPEKVPDVIAELRDELKKLRGPSGEQWKNMLYTPQELYPVVNGDAPDTLVYLDDLNWRAAGTIGWPTPYLEENDKGPDDAVHDWYGVFTIYDPEGTIESGDKGVIDIVDVKKKILEAMGVKELTKNDNVEN
ncbi:alkaline phosphatase family protein [Desulfurococcaceae archaeon MEX13E-LK6-19]|nr:alkaline phosphatase family protein [Desulfurococcaceae archaeon MEX13E-LK6-19]